MTRSLSDAALSSLLAQETPEAYLVLLELFKDGGTSLIKIASDSQNVVNSNGTYVPFPFDLTLLSDQEEQVPRATLTLSNVTRELIDDIRSITTPLTASMWVVLSSDPDDVMAEFHDMILHNVQYNTLTISGDLTLESFLNEPVSKIMGGQNYAGLF